MGSIFFPFVNWDGLTIIPCDDGDKITGPFGKPKTVGKGRAVQRGSVLFIERSDYAELKRLVPEKPHDH